MAKLKQKTAQQKRREKEVRNLQSRIATRKRKFEKDTGMKVELDVDMVLNLSVQGYWHDAKGKAVDAILGTRKRSLSATEIHKIRGDKLDTILKNYAVIKLEDSDLSFYEYIETLAKAEELRRKGKKTKGGQPVGLPTVKRSKGWQAYKAFIEDVSSPKYDAEKNRLFIENFTKSLACIKGTKTYDAVMRRINQLGINKAVNIIMSFENVEQQVINYLLSSRPEQIFIGLRRLMVPFGLNPDDFAEEWVR